MKLKHHLYLGLSFPILGLLIAFPDYIPPLEEFFFGLVLVCFGVASYFLFKFSIIYVKKEREREGKHTFRIILVNFVLWGLLIFLGLISAIVFSGGFLGPSYVMTYEGKKVNSTLYIYDASFLHRMTTVKVKHPDFHIFTKNLTSFPKVAPDALEIREVPPDILFISKGRRWVRYKPESGELIDEDKDGNPLN